MTNKCFHLNMLLVYLDFLRYSGVDHSLNHLKPSMLYWKIIKEKRKDLEAHLFHVSQFLNTQMKSLITMSDDWASKCQSFSQKSINLSEINLFLHIPESD